MEDLLRVGERMSTAENPLGANPDTKSPFDIYRQGNAPMPQNGGMPGGDHGAMPPQGFGGLSKEELEQLMGGHTAEEMAQWSPEELEAYLKRYEAILNKNRSDSMNKAQLGKIDHEGATVVEPEPGFVLKTSFVRGANAGLKLFLNICTHEMVEKPHIQSIVPEGQTEPEEAMRIPVSVGPPIEDFDKKKEQCITVDVLVHPDVVEKCESSPETKLMVVEFSVNAVSTKYKWFLDTGNVKYPKIKYKGPVQYQRIRVTKKSEISEVGAQPAEGGGGSSSGSSSGVADKDIDLIETPEFEVWYERMDVEDESPEEVINGFDLPCYDSKSELAEKFRNKYGGSSSSSESDRNPARQDPAPPLSIREQTDALLRNRKFVCHVRLPKLRRLNIGKQLDLHLRCSSELERQRGGGGAGRSAAGTAGGGGRGPGLYLPLKVWFPRQFCSSQAEAVWDSGSKTLTVRVPTSAGTMSELPLDDDLLNEIF